MTPAYAYCRVSGPDQVDGDGFLRQEAEITKFSALSSHSISNIYCEQVTGKSESLDRPVWVEMITQMLLTGVKVIIIESLNRLARDLMVQEHIIADLRKRGITLISATEPDLCRDDPTRKLMRQIMGAFAEYDRAMIVAKTYAARKRIRDAGNRCEGRKPYGYFPEEGPVVVEMRRLYGTGMNMLQITQELNRRQVRSRAGKAWQSMVVGRILKR